MAASKSGPRAPKTILGRRNCAVCKRWRHITDFPPRTWADKKKTQIKYVQSECGVCRSRKAGKRYANYTPRDKRRRNASSRVWHRKDRRQRGIKEHGPLVRSSKKRGSVRREPFAFWLREQLETLSVRTLSDRTGLSARRIHAFVNGYDSAGRYKRRSSKRRAIDWIRFETIDHALANWGEPWIINELYPPEPLPEPEYEDEPVVNDVEDEEAVEFGPRTDPALDRDWDSFESLIETAPNCSTSSREFVPDLIGEYERRLAVRSQKRRQRA